MSTGQIIEVIGAVVDVEFPSGQVPKVYDALNVDEKGLTLEVQQQLGDGIVRTIAMGASDGLQRGLKVSNTDAPITVPVGPKTLGRVMNVLGEPVDNAGDIGADSGMPIHRPPPTFEEQAGGNEDERMISDYVVHRVLQVSGFNRQVGLRSGPVLWPSNPQASLSLG